MVTLQQNCIVLKTQSKWPKTVQEEKAGCLYFELTSCLKFSHSVIWSELTHFKRKFASGLKLRVHVQGAFACIQKT